MKINLLSNKNKANKKKTKELLYFSFNNEQKNKIFLRLTNFTKEKIFLISFFG